MGRPIRTRRSSAHGDVRRDSLRSPLRYFPESKQQTDKVLPGVRFCHLATGIAARRWPATVSARQLPASPSSLVPFDSHRSCPTNTGSLLSSMFTGRSLGSPRVAREGEASSAQLPSAFRSRPLLYSTSFPAPPDESLPDPQRNRPASFAGVFLDTRSLTCAEKTQVRCAAQTQTRSGLRFCRGEKKTCSLVVLALA